MSIINQLSLFCNNILNVLQRNNKYNKKIKKINNNTFQSMLVMLQSESAEKI